MFLSKILVHLVISVYQLIVRVMRLPKPIAAVNAVDTLHGSLFPTLCPYKNEFLHNNNDKCPYQYYQ